tara:strand:- start:28 stop:1578 length:1551 start_codon:yes stop_codon:yes gene_type:complete
MKPYFLLLFFLFASATEATDRPNILLLIADDASRDSFGAYGCPYIQTPHFDRIAREGIRFTQAYNCNPKCAPARACLLTGRYSWQLKEACNHNPFLSDQWVFYPYLLEASGYVVGFTGKGWGPGIYQNVDVGRSGFKSPGNPAGHPYNRHTAVPPFRGMSHKDYARNFSDFLNEKPDDQPFCFWLGTHEPHRGYGKNNWKLDGRDLDQVTVPAYYPDTPGIRGDLADYAIEVEYYDTQIGRALALLEQHALLETTLVIATSDHGMPFPRVKGQIYEDGVRVPFAVRWGDRIPPGQVVTDFITFPDLAPTLLEIAGLPSHSQMTGQSFTRQLFAARSGRIDPDRSFTLLGKERHDIGRTDGEQLSVAYPVRAIRTDRFLYIRNFMPHRWPVGDPDYGFLNCDGSPTKSLLQGLATDESLQHYFEWSFGKRPPEELYDILADPDCLENLADRDRFRARKQTLWQTLQTELTAQDDPRILGNGEIFDLYPNCRVDRQQTLYGKPDYDPVKGFQRRYGHD